MQQINVTAKVKAQTVLEKAMVAARLIQGRHRITANAERNVSTLKPDPRFANHQFVSSVKINNGFLYFYRCRVKSPRLAWPALATALLFPQLPQRVPAGKVLAMNRQIVNNLSTTWTDAGVSALTSVKKTGSNFILKLPFCVLHKENVTALRQLFCGDTFPSDLNIEPVPLETFHGEGMSMENVKDVGGMFTKHMPKLRELPSGRILVEEFKERIVFLMEFSVSEKQSEFLCNSPWMQIRPIDMYGLIRTWVDGRYGIFSKPPRFAIPLSNIANSVRDVKGEPRVSKDGILVDENADYWYIPEHVDNINKFDTELVEHLKRSDGSFAAVSTNPEEVLTPTPPSQPVFTDWVNLKFAFTSVDGKLLVKSLDRAMPANITHVARLLSTRVISARGANAYSLLASMAMGLDSSIRLPKINEAVESLILAIHSRDGEAETQPGDIELIDMWRTHSWEFAPLFRKAVASINELVQNSFETLCVKFSVQTACRVVAFTRLLSLYGDQFDIVQSRDREARRCYETQRIDPNYHPDSIPYLEDERFLLPHQGRGQNLLRESPQFAILSVAAGGGKTTMIITDILKMMKLGQVKRALVMCPAHLVAQYVKEFVYFTGGRVNVIAANSYTMHKRRHGIEGIEAMIRNSPVNTVVVTDYNIGLGKTKKQPIGYGVAPTSVFPVVEMLRRFRFDYVACDESHFLKGVTGRQSAVARLISEIHYKRLASGTVTPNSLVDLVKQVALMDPTVFGSQSDFVEKYALETRGDKVMKWRPNAEIEMMAQLKSSIVMVSAKRKEWAALLPDLVEEGIAVELTPKQKTVYTTILNEVTEKIQEELKNNKALRKLLGVARADDAEEGDEDEDTSETMDVDALLKPFLQRLEQFVVSPGADPLGSTMLTPEEAVSPKVIKVIEVIRAHLAKGGEGKILIFTNYVQSAETIYESLPPDLKEMCVHYTANNKAECGAEFETNPKKKIMVGVEQSMNTGLNLQFCDHLIRVDSVWTPGALEQGNSRIGRPNIKVAETRPNIYITWISASGTIDITKMAYLLTKRISVAKFENAGNPLFDVIETPPLFPMTLDMIANSNTTTSEELIDHFRAYDQMHRAQFQDYADYRREHPEDMEADGRSVKKVVLERAPNLPGSALMYRIPYVPGVEIYKSDDLGLVRYDQYMRQDIDEDSDEDEGDDEDDDTPETNGDEDEGTKRSTVSREELERNRGLYVHTEYGDGEIVGVSRKFLRVELPSGNRFQVSKLSAFVINRAQTSRGDMRSAILKESGDIPFTVPSDVQVRNATQVVIPKAPIAPVDDTVSASLNIVTCNDFVGVEFDGVSKNPAAAKFLQASGFVQPLAHVYAAIPTAQHMLKQFKAWKDAGFEIEKHHNQACVNMYSRLATSRKNAATMIGLSTSAGIQNFFRMERKPIMDKKIICPYPLVYNDTLYIALPTKGHPATFQAIKVKAPGIRFYTADTEDQLVAFAPSLSIIDRNISKLMSRGLVISNIKDLVKERKRLHRVTPKLLEGLRKKAS